MTKLDPNWIDSESGAVGDVMTISALGVPGWAPVSSSGGDGRAIFSCSFNIGSNKTYIENGSSSWRAIAYMVYPGTNVVTASEFIVVGSNNNNSTNSECRVIDLSTNLEVANVSWSVKNIAIYSDGSLANLPASRSLFEIQLRRISGGKSRVHSCLVI